MIAEVGLGLLWFAAAFAALQLAFSIMALKGRRGELTVVVGPVAIAQGLLCVGAFLALICLFVRSDMSVLLVARESHSDLPLLYRIAGSWGNHEGSMLLWVTVMGLAGAAVALLERTLDRDTHVATLGAQAAISLGFYAFLLFASNPFARLVPAPANGNGVNPLLQDPGLAFHPPTLYIGYVGLSVAFSFAVGALLTRKVDPAFARAMRPWVLGSWVFLTLGITAGSYWAYYELGWGGWWFWDPVENASLMPWLAATALLHSVSVLATRDGLRAWTIMLAVVAFSMSMVGTFLVRSGILTSVHAFAVDPQRGTFILALLLLTIGGALTLFALRIGSVQSGSLFEPVSREGGLVINNLLLSAILGIVFVGTLYPLAVEGVTGEKLSVGPPYFNAAAGPLALLLAALMIFGPLIRWRRDRLALVMKRGAAGIGVAILLLIALLLLAPGTGLLPLFGLALGGAVVLGSFLPLVGRNLRRTPLATYAMVLAHVGIGVSLVGMASDSAFTIERLAAVRPGERVQVGDWTVTLTGIEPVVGPNWTALEGTLAVARDGGAAEVLHPQSRFFAGPQTETSESAILTRWNGQLYTVLGKQAEDGRWQLRLWWKPFVTLIWLGGGLVALGGVLALLGRFLRARRGRRAWQRAYS